MEIIKTIGQEGKAWSKEGRKAIADIGKAVKEYKPWGKKGGKTKSKTSQMMKGTGTRDAEVKRVDLKLDAATAMVSIAAVAGAQDFSTGMVCTNLIQQGTGDMNRIANKVKVFQTMIETELSRDAGDAFVRGMVVFDSSPDGTYPAIGDIIKTCDQTGGTNTGFFSANNVHNTDRFRVLRNKVYTLDTYHPKMHMKYVLKNQYDVQYDGTANPLTISSLLKGAVYWIFFYSGSAPKFTNTYIRCKFTDK